MVNCFHEGNMEDEIKSVKQVLKKAEGTSSTPDAPSIKRYRKF